MAKKKLESLYVFLVPTMAVVTVVGKDLADATKRLPEEGEIDAYSTPLWDKATARSEAKLS